MAPAAAVEVPLAATEIEVAVLAEPGARRPGSPWCLLPLEDFWGRAPKLHEVALGVPLMA